jgi:hypothetical protein
VSSDMSTFEEMGDSWNIEDHVHILRIEKESDEPDDEYALMRCLSDLQNLEIPRDKPLWDVHIVENYSRGNAMMWRIHHSKSRLFQFVYIHSNRRWLLAGHLVCIFE